MKKWLIFGGGVLTGIVLTLLLSIALYYKQNKVTAASEKAPIESVAEEDSPITMFDEPGDVIETKSFKVLQSVCKGAALSYTEENGSYYMGLLCLLVDEKGKYYYDDEIVKVPAGKVVRQVGVFEYENGAGMAKTVPVVKIMDK